MDVTEIDLITDLSIRNGDFLFDAAIFSLSLVCISFSLSIQGQDFSEICITVIRPYFPKNKDNGFDLLLARKSGPRGWGMGLTKLNALSLSLI